MATMEPRLPHRRPSEPSVVREALRNISSSLINLSEALTMVTFFCSFPSSSLVGGFGTVEHVEMQLKERKKNGELT